MEPELRAYLAANVPGWVLAAVAAWAAVRWFDVGWPIVAAFVALWIAKDALLYPVMRRFYRSTPAERRIVGEQGTVLRPLDPRGLVRVRGEIWRARVVDRADTMSAGTTVRVCDVDGLTLTVEPAPPSIPETTASGHHRAPAT